MTADRPVRALASPAPRATVPSPSSTKPVIMIQAFCESRAASALTSSRRTLYSCWANPLASQATVNATGPATAIRPSHTPREAGFMFEP